MVAVQFPAVHDEVVDAVPFCVPCMFMADKAAATAVLMVPVALDFNFIITLEFVGETIVLVALAVEVPDLAVSVNPEGIEYVGRVVFCPAAAAATAAVPCVTA